MTTTTSYKILVNHGYAVVSNADGSHSVADPLSDADGFYMTGTDLDAVCLKAATQILVEMIG
jgi:hypothetical protein